MRGTLPQRKTDTVKIVWNKEKLWQKVDQKSQMAEVAQMYAKDLTGYVR